MGHESRRDDTKLLSGTEAIESGIEINAVVLIIGSLFILSQAIPRLLNPEHSNARGMLALSILGILVNGAAVLRLRGGKTMNAQVIAWHLLEDVLGWIAVLIVSISSSSPTSTSSTRSYPF